MHWEVRQHINILRAGTGGSIVLCISPLTALMMDQQSKFALMGISTEYVAEHSNPDSVKRVLNGQAQLVYISPECTIGNAKFRSMLLSPIYKKNLVAFVVDEAHCVKTWYVQLFMCAVNQNFVIMHRYKHDNKDITASHTCILTKYARRCLILCRGDEFRISFALLGELRSIIPDRVNVLAITATATKDTLLAVKERLSMSDPAIVALPPEKENIIYSEQTDPDFGKELADLIAELKAKGSAFPQTIIFCQRYLDCASIYQDIRASMAAEFTDPLGSPNYLHQFRLTDMYHAATTADLKEKVIHSFCSMNSKLCLLIATTAFGLGIDCPDIRRVYHWGSPHDLNSYVQETGRAGSDHHRSDAVLLYGKVQPHTSRKMRSYAETAQCCRRITLFRDFLLGEDVQSITPGCRCCDIVKHCASATLVLTKTDHTIWKLYSVNYYVYI